MELVEAFDILKNKVVNKNYTGPAHPEELYLLSLVSSYRTYIISSEEPTIEKLSLISKKQSKSLLSLLKNIAYVTEEFKLENDIVVEKIDSKELVDPHNIIQYIINNIKDENFPFDYDKTNISKIIKTIFRIIAKDDRILKDIFLKYAYSK